MKTRSRYRLDFRALMAQCESNYARLLPLIRALGDQDTLDLAFGDERPHTLNIRVLERAPYTTTLRLQDQALHDAMPAPRLTVRLYHDARVAEVTEASPFQRVQARYPYPNDKMHQRDEKAQWNRFLGEWLSHVQEHGRDAALHWPRATS
ncbi:DUF1249 domain-containing protein [Alloalcanivorax mobilis]|uniref:DUF1249 domain-containing protein n=1 Tax=Alloalcanivorax mobilis TaxID=2019569 RepID=UPI0018E4B992|nr:DUF1249 domain-containing protein [Alloalcanivorax mobilis]